MQPFRITIARQKRDKEVTTLNSDDMRRGIVPGLIAGYLFFAYAGQDVQGMAPPFGGHVTVSVLFGALYTGVFMQYVDLGNPLVNIVVGGLFYGLFWWIVGWNIILPLVYGEAIIQLHIGSGFYGHIIFGQTLAFLVVLRDAAFGMTWGNYSDRAVARMPRLKHPAGNTYHASSSSYPGQVKIGRTNNPGRRLGELRREFGSDMKYISMNKSDNAPGDEKRLHRRLSPLRRLREFFDIF